MGQAAAKKTMNPAEQGRVLQDFFEGAGYSVGDLKESSFRPWVGGRDDKMGIYWFQVWAARGEGDAVVEVHQDRIIIASHSKSFVTEVRKLLSQLGYHAGVSYKTARGHFFEMTWGA